MTTLKKRTKSDNKSLFQKKEKLTAVSCMLLISGIILAVLCLPPSYMNPTLIGSVLVFSCAEVRLYQNWKQGATSSFSQGISVARKGVSAVLSIIFLGMLSIKELWGIHRAFNSRIVFVGYILSLFFASFYLIDDLLAHYMRNRGGRR